MYNILTEPLIRMDKSDDSRVAASLPEVYEALMADKVEAFPALRPHQRHAWHAFLSQLGAMSVYDAGLPEPPRNSDEWERVIRGLTRVWQEDEPWQLVVDDITKPAFMQPPASSVERELEYKPSADTPDELDMLVTSKNHDVKASVGGRGNVDDWLFALVTVQTMDGNPGRNPGIARMNGAHGSRPGFSLAPIKGVGAHVKRDIGLLVEYLPTLIRQYRMIDNGIGLLWTQKWDGKSEERLNLEKLNPVFIEVCRRIRLRYDGRLDAVKATAQANRIEAKARNGIVGDPWTPVNRKENKSLTLAKDGFTYKRVAEYLRTWEHPALLKQTREERRSPEDMGLVARAMVRGQGKSEGYYERVITLRPRTVSRLNVQELGTLAKERIDDVGKVQDILKDAIATFIARGKNIHTDLTSNERSRVRTNASTWSDRLDEVVDATFFDRLQDEFNAPRGERTGIRKRWLLNGVDRDGVIDQARSLLEDATDSLPCPAAFRYKALVVAKDTFEGRIRRGNGLPNVFDEERGEE